MMQSAGHMLYTSLHHATTVTPGAPAADLLDILSKGSNPQLILRHLSKNFDNVHNLTFRKDDRDEFTKAAIGMHSGEGEYVEFAEDCMCDGPVELWLQNVVDSMKAGLISEFRKAVPAYDDTPRSTWIFKYSAQNTIVVSRIMFTSEVGAASQSERAAAMLACCRAAPSPLLHVGHRCRAPGMQPCH